MEMLERRKHIYLIKQNKINIQSYNSIHRTVMSELQFSNTSADEYLLLNVFVFNMKAETLHF